MTNFILRNLKHIIFELIIDNFQELTTIQSNRPLKIMVGVIVYVIMFVIGASVEKSIPGLYYSVIVFPLATWGIMSSLNKLESWEDKSQEKSGRIPAA